MFLLMKTFHFLDKSSPYNYADDNTLSYAHSISDTLIYPMQHDCTSTLQVFKINQMKANPTKFQAISFGKRGIRDIINFTFENSLSRQWDWSFMVRHAIAVYVGGQLSRNVDKQVFGPYCLQYSHYNTENRLSILLLRRAFGGYLVLYIYNEN